jgi:hypothetical protein
MAEQGQEADQNDRGPGRRKSVVDRRTGVGRRGERPAAKATNLERRRGPGRRRTDFMRAAEEGEMTQEQFMFVMAIDSFKRVKKLGYRKTMTSELNLGARVEDWTERHDTPSGVSKEAENESDQQEEAA